ncbi:hypothetical protein CH63R_14358 [Colletotrichum higginsianum IMI 349063]|uniref:Uncharacterized protein n=1 Tax=Colletotrichum higginsianum (strain IMI 349063) TaxID=759273 RepID=A0A1B7XTP0_COLHI|nr:hypothetical protein CH63R_14358 [Colletotrichum higginsianum IMI 349063]OBR03132.1 hypothetical protein CH63R_14358 [Colletotrichum higginsianum IMI 349063]
MSRYTDSRGTYRSSRRCYHDQASLGLLGSSGFIESIMAWPTEQRDGANQGSLFSCSQNI